MGVRVTVNSGFTNVWLPDGHTYNEGDTADLTDAEFATLTDQNFVDRVLADLTPISDPSREGYPLVNSIFEAAPLIQELDSRVTTLENIVL